MCLTIAVYMFTQATYIREWCCMKYITTGPCCNFFNFPWFRKLLLYLTIFKLEWIKGTIFHTGIVVLNQTDAGLYTKKYRYINLTSRLYEKLYYTILMWLLRWRDSKQSCFFIKTFKGIVTNTIIVLVVAISMSIWLLWWPPTESSMFMVSQLLHCCPCMLSFIACILLGLN